MRKLKLSRYNYYVETSDNEMIIFNSITKGIEKYDASNFHLDSEKKTIRLAKPEESLHPSMFLNGFVLDSEIDEMTYIRNLFNSKILCFNKRYLGVTLLPTLKCNFSCSYCYEEISNSGDTSRVDMSDEILAQFYAFVDNQTKNLDKLHVNLYGGEPLMDIDRSIKIMDNIYRISNGNNCVLSLSIITNGYNLTNEVLDFLVSKKIKTFFQITLDGARETHDSMRFLHDGQKTFDRIVSNIRNLIALKHHNLFQVSIRVNFNEDNRDTLFKLCDQLNEEGLLADVNLYPAEIFAMETPNCADTKARSAGIELQKELTNYINKKTGQNRLTPNHTFIKKQLCAMLMRNSVVIDPRGNLYKCYMEINNLERCIGHISELYKIRGNLTNIEIANTSKLDVEMCKECPALPLCMLYCPWETLQNKKCQSFGKFVREDITNYIEGRMNIDVNTTRHLGFITSS